MSQAPLAFEAVARVLRSARSVFFTVHQRPDGDALGSQLALGIALRSLGVKVWMANEDPVPERYAFMPGSRGIRTGPAGLPARFDVAVVLECATPKRAGTCGALVRRAKNVINIDHHLNNANYGTYNLVDVTAPATIMLAESLREMLGVPMTKDIALNFYVGLYTETGGFRYNNTTPDVLRLASQLVEAGVNPRFVGEQIYERMPLRRMKILARALDSLTVRDGVAWMAVTQADFKSMQATEEDVEDFVEYPRAVKGVKMAAFLRETPAGDVRVSLRAKSTTPVHKIAEHFGGGGHAYAAGCTVPHANAEEARRRLAITIRAHVRRSSAPRQRRGTSAKT
jgi:phosphoesterase RecJ-like protein